jgi:hypothetical protein
VVVVAVEVEVVVVAAGGDSVAEQAAAARQPADAAMTSPLLNTRLPRTPPSLGPARYNRESSTAVW